MHADVLFVVRITEASAEKAPNLHLKTHIKIRPLHHGTINDRWVILKLKFVGQQSLLFFIFMRDLILSCQSVLVIKAENGQTVCSTNMCVYDYAWKVE